MKTPPPPPAPPQMSATEHAIEKLFLADTPEKQDVVLDGILKEVKVGVLPFDEALATGLAKVAKSEDAVRAQRLVYVLHQTSAAAGAEGGQLALKYLLDIAEATINPSVVVDCVSAATEILQIYPQAAHPAVNGAFQALASKVYPKDAAAAFEKKLAFVFEKFNSVHEAAAAAKKPAPNSPRQPFNLKPKPAPVVIPVTATPPTPPPPPPKPSAPPLHPYVKQALDSLEMILDDNARIEILQKLGDALVRNPKLVTPGLSALIAETAIHAGSEPIAGAAIDVLRLCGGAGHAFEALADVAEKTQDNAVVKLAVSRAEMLFLNEPGEASPDVLPRFEALADKKGLKSKDKREIETSVRQMRTTFLAGPHGRNIHDILEVAQKTSVHATRLAAVGAGKELFSGQPQWASGEAFLAFENLLQKYPGGAKTKEYDEMNQALQDMQDVFFGVSAQSVPDILYVARNTQYPTTVLTAIEAAAKFEYFPAEDFLALEALGSEKKSQKGDSGLSQAVQNMRENFFLLVGHDPEFMLEVAQSTKNSLTIAAAIRATAELYARDPDAIVPETLAAFKRLADQPEFSVIEPKKRWGLLGGKYNTASDPVADAFESLRPFYERALKASVIEDLARGAARRVVPPT